MSENKGECLGMIPTDTNLYLNEKGSSKSRRVNEIVCER